MPFTQSSQWNRMVMTLTASPQLKRHDGTVVPLNFSDGEPLKMSDLEGTPPGCTAQIVGGACLESARQGDAFVYNPRTKAYAPIPQATRGGACSRRLAPGDTFVLGPLPRCTDAAGQPSHDFAGGFGPYRGETTDARDAFEYSIRTDLKCIVCNEWVCLGVVPPCCVNHRDIEAVRSGRTVHRPGPPAPEPSGDVFNFVNFNFIMLQVCCLRCLRHLLTESSSAVRCPICRATGELTPSVHACALAFAS